MASSFAFLFAWSALFSSSYSLAVLPFAPRAVVIDDITQLNTKYDYVVVGGGTSGLVVANRLTENPDSKCCPLS